MPSSTPKMKFSHFIITTIIDVAIFLIGYYALFWHIIVNWKLCASVVVAFIVNRFLIKTFSLAFEKEQEHSEYLKPSVPLPLNETNRLSEIVTNAYSSNRPTLIFSIHGVLHRNQNETLEFKNMFMDMLADIPNIQLVLSSDWRTDCDEPWLKCKLGDDLFSKIVAYTPVTLKHDRSLEIEMLLEYKPVTKFIILDADHVMTTRPNGKVIKTESYIGIQEHHLNEIRDYLT